MYVFSLKVLTLYGACLDVSGKSSVAYQKCVVGETESHVLLKVTIKTSEIGIDAAFYKKGVIITVEDEKYKLECAKVNDNGFTAEYQIIKHDKYQDWDPEKKIFYNKIMKEYIIPGYIAIECAAL